MELSLIQPGRDRFMSESPRSKFQQLLRELFQLDAAGELDFGIYRIIGQKREVVEKFIKQELLDVIASELNTGAIQEESKIADQLAELAEQIRENLDDEAIDAEGNLDSDHHKTKLGKQYLALQQKATGAQPAETREATIYNHLYHFFSRYYDKGDFMSLRRYSQREKYAIPYNGEEVYLHWANADQYYIKTGETFTDYRWKDPSGSVRVSFTVTRANVPKDNIKAPDKRYFIPQIKSVTVEPISSADKNNRLGDSPGFESDKTVAIAQTAGYTLVTVPFHYRGLTDKEIKYWESEASDRGLKNSNGNGGKIQTAMLAVATEKIPDLAVVKKNKDAESALIGEKRKGSDGSPVSRLQHHLKRFAAKNTSDYFIHKDLGGFLTRELDFFLKNEVLNLDSLEAGGEARADGWFQMMGVIRRIGGKIIEFLAQLENFQKRLFEKKKFVTECHYCITLDRVPEELYGEIAKNEGQIEEWKALFAIDEEQGWKEPPTIKFLKDNTNLVIDTKFFHPSSNLRMSITNEIPDPDGQLICGHNFDALNSLRQTSAGTVNAIYIDPPYNTGEDEFIYKDQYQHASWLSLMNQLISPLDAILDNNGGLAVSLNDVESSRFELLMQNFSERFETLGQFVWKTRNTDNRIKTRFSVDHDYIHMYCRPSSHIEGRIVDRSDFKHLDNDSRGPYTTDPLTGKANAEARPNLHYTIVNSKTGDTYPPDPDFGWITDENGFNLLVDDNRVYWPANPKTGKPRKKRFLSEASDRSPVGSLSISISQGEGNTDLSSLFGFKPMNFPKPVSVVRRVVDVTTRSDGFVLDCFAGSGTTGQAVVEANREDDGLRRYCLVELGKHFDSVLVPRLKKTIYSANWENGKPTDRSTGVSHLIKYLRLESYEDALSNIAFSENENAQKQFSFDEYCINYMLEFETSESETLLNIEKLASPFEYTLEIRDGEESTFKQVDLPETFNFLIGLRVQTRKVYWRKKGTGAIAQMADKNKIKYLVVRGRTNPHAIGGEREVVVIWRTTKDWKKEELEADKKFIEDHELTKDADEVFVNCDSFVKDANSLDPVFKRRMFNEE